MKRRIETTMVWDFEKFDDTSGEKVGVLTNLPPPRKEKGIPRPRITEVTVYSKNGSIEGCIHVQLDSGCEEGPMDDTNVAVLGLFSQWYRDHITSGSGGTGYHFFQHGFELRRSETSFCDTAIKKVIMVLKSLGVGIDQIPDPKVTQRTYVWIPKKKGWTTHEGRREHGWVDYGRWLASRYKLNEHERSYPIYD